MKQETYKGLTPRLTPNTTPNKNPHALQEQRSQTLHTLIAKLYQQDPERVIAHALSNLAKWKRQGVQCHAYEEWEKILLTNPQAIPDILKSLNPKHIELRQSSPFAGILPEKIRQNILKTTHTFPNLDNSQTSPILPQEKPTP